MDDDKTRLVQILSNLEKARILRFNNSIYELTHDSIAQQISSTLSEEEIKTNEARKVLSSRYDAFHVTKSFLTDEELRLINPRISALEPTPVQLKYFHKSRKKIRNRKIALGALYAAIGIAISAVAFLVRENRIDSEISDAIRKKHEVDLILREAQNYFLKGEKFFADYEKKRTKNDIVKSLITEFGKAEKAESFQDFPQSRNKEEGNERSLRNKFSSHSKGVPADIGAEARTDLSTLDSAAYYYGHAWRLDTTLFNALIGLVNVQLRKSDFDVALKTFKSEIALIKARRIKNLVCYKIIENISFPSDPLERIKAQGFIYDLHEFVLDKKYADDDQLSYVPVKLLHLAGIQSTVVQSARLHKLVGTLLKEKTDDSDVDMDLVVGGYYLSSKTKKDSIAAKKVFDNVGNRADKGVQFISPQTLWLIGEYYYQIGQFNIAYKYYKKATEFVPVPTKEMYHSLGLARRHVDDMASAFEYFRKALALDPENTDYLEHASNCLYSLSRYAEAIRLYDRILQIDPKDENALHYKGKSYEGLKNYKGAYQTFHLLTKIQPDKLHYETAHFAPDAISLSRLATEEDSVLFYRNQGLESYRRAVAAAENTNSSELGTLYNELASNLCEYSKDLDEAFIFSTKSLQKATPEKIGGFYLTLGKIYSKQNKSNSAEIAIQKSIESAEANGDIDLLNSIASYYQDQDPSQFEKAAKVFDRALKLDPQNVDVIHFRGQNLEFMGKYPEASEVFKVLAERFPDNYHFLGDHFAADLVKSDSLDLAQIELGLKNYQKAIALAETKLRNTSDPDVQRKVLVSISTFYNSMAWDMAMHDIDLPNALNYSARSIELCQRDNDRGEFLDTKAEIYFRMNDMARAYEENESARKFAQRNEKLMMSIDQRAIKIASRKN